MVLVASVARFLLLVISPHLKLYVGSVQLGQQEVFELFFSTRAGNRVTIHDFSCYSLGASRDNRGCGMLVSILEAGECENQTQGISGS